ncbi:MAG: type II secretion system protein [Planctomycetota bacterium]
MQIAHPTSPPRRRGFTLNEVLIAMGILAVGITATASLFPSAIILQKRAVKDAQFQQNTRSAEALLKARGIDAEELFEFSDNVTGKNGATNIFPAYDVREAEAIADPEFDVYALAELDTVWARPMPPGMPNPTNAVKTDMRVGSYQFNESLLLDWPETDRSFPSIETDPAQREFFYVPLFRRGPEATPYINDWVVYAFVLQAQPEVSDPTAGQPKYPNDPANPAYDNPNATPNGAVCANPLDNTDYFPKVFRAEVTNWTGSVATLAGGWNVGEILRLGNEVLGDDGEVYRVGDVNIGNNTITLNLVSRQTFDAVTIGGGTELDAVWFAMPPNSTEANPPSPVRDIRVLSRGTVKLEDYQ